MLWKRKGFATREAYDAACRAASKTKREAVKNSRCKHTTRAVLMHICFGPYQQFEKCDVVFTKAQLQADLGGCDRKTIQMALRFLRDEGTIVPIKNWQGGKHVPTTYRIEATGQGASQDVPEPPPEGEGGDADPVLARMKEICAERPDIDAMKAFAIAEQEINGKSGA